MRSLNEEKNVGFTNIAQPSINRKMARRQRAAQRLQASGLVFKTWDSTAQQHLKNKLEEFKGLCRNGAFHYTNVKAAASNILAPAAKVMGDKNYQHWLAVFVEDGVRACSKDMR